MKGFSASLDMRRWKDQIIKSVPKNIQLSKDLSHRIPWSTQCLSLPCTPSGGAEGHQLQRQMAKAFVVQQLEKEFKSIEFLTKLTRDLNNFIKLNYARIYTGFPGGSSDKEPALSMQQMRVRFQGWEDPLGKKTATHSSILAWRIPWIEDLGGLQPIRSQSRT